MTQNNITFLANRILLSDQELVDLYAAAFSAVADPKVEAKYKRYFRLRDKLGNEILDRGLEAAAQAAMQSKDGLLP